MTDIDVQLKPTGVSIVYPDNWHDENLPGELHLTFDEGSSLRDQLNEAWFNRYGLQPMSIPAGDVEKGDIIPSLGLTVDKVFRLSDDTGLVVIQFGHNYERKRMQLPTNLEITVHRRIS